jgi:hypothetical protein
MEATYGGTGQLPPEHLHPQQVERLYGDGPDSARAATSIADFLADFSDEIRLTGA